MASGSRAEEAFCVTAGNKWDVKKSEFGFTWLAGEYRVPKSLHAHGRKHDGRYFHSHSRALVTPTATPSTKAKIRTLLGFPLVSRRGVPLLLRCCCFGGCGHGVGHKSQDRDHWVVPDKLQAADIHCGSGGFAGIASTETAAQKVMLRNVPRRSSRRDRSRGWT